MGVVSGVVMVRGGLVMSVTEGDRPKSVGLQPCSKALKRE